MFARFFAVIDIHVTVPSFGRPNHNGAKISAHRHQNAEATELPKTSPLQPTSSPNSAPYTTRLFQFYRKTTFKMSDEMETKPFKFVTAGTCAPVRFGSGVLFAGLSWSEVGWKACCASDMALGGIRRLGRETGCSGCVFFRDQC